MEALEFRNDTEQTWTAALFIFAEASAGQRSVAWKVLRTAAGGVSRLSWDDSLCGVIAARDGNVFRWTDRLPLKAGEAAKIVERDGVRSFERDGDAPSEDQIAIRNETASPVNAGLAQSESAAIYVSDLAPRATSLFRAADRQYQLGIYDAIEPGRLYTRPELGPLAVTISPGVTSVVATLRRDEEGATVMTIDYGLRPGMPVNRVRG